MVEVYRRNKISRIREHIHEAHKASEDAQEDVINHMPDDVISLIMNLLPIKDAVRTSVLSRSWRSKWTLCNQLVFDDGFFGPNRQGIFNSNIISRILLHLKGAVTKFVLMIPYGEMLSDYDVSPWVMIFSQNGIKELVITNTHPSPLWFPTCLFSCLNLTHLTIHNGSLSMPLSFCGFPNLLTLDLHGVAFKSGNIEGFITKCPLLEDVCCLCNYPTGKVKSTEIMKLKYLKYLCLQLCNLENIAIKSSDIFEFIDPLPKLEVLNLDFIGCKLVAAPRMLNPTGFSCLKTLTLYNIDLSSFNAISCAYDMIWKFPNLHTLFIVATYQYAVMLPQPPLITSEEDYSTWGKLRLQDVEFSYCNGLSSDVELIKSILACSPLLKRFLITVYSSQDFGANMMFATDLLNLRRASPIARINLQWILNNAPVY